MANTKPKRTQVLGQYKLGTTKINVSAGKTPPKSLYYTRTHAKEGLILGARSEPVFYYRSHGGGKPPYGAKQVFTLTTFQIYPSPTWQTLPVVFSPFSGPTFTLAICRFDQAKSYGGYKHGQIHVSGFNNGPAGSVWNFALESINDEDTNAIVPHGAFSLIYDMTPQAIIDINYRLYPLVPGWIIVPNNTGNTISKLQYALY